MEVRPYAMAEIANRETVMEGADMRVNVLTLDADQCIPWHYHSEITDYFVCLEGTLVVETKVPAQSIARQGRCPSEIPHRPRRRSVR